MIFMMLSVCLSIKKNNCVAVFTGTNDPDRFDDLIDSLDIDWSYLSYDDEEDDDEE